MTTSNALADTMFGHGGNLQLEQGQHVHVQLQQCERRLAEVSAQLQAAVAERDAAKRDAITAAAAVPQKTAAELQVGHYFGTNKVGLAYF